jgi:hypothetical protein
MTSSRCATSRNCAGSGDEASVTLVLETVGDSRRSGL